jgi:hypothetical protein
MSLNGIYDITVGDHNRMKLRSYITSAGLNALIQLSKSNEKIGDIELTPMNLSEHDLVLTRPVTIERKKLEKLLSFIAENDEPCVKYIIKVFYANF